MTIRRAVQGDISALSRLLREVLEVHHRGRPDIFKSGVRKYTNEELRALIDDENSPIFVAANEENAVMGYAFCKFQQHINDNILTDIKTLYIDDLCVDESLRGQHVGRTLYDFCVAFARERGCYNLTLNVWACNESALRFYEKCGLLPQKMGLEKIL